MHNIINYLPKYITIQDCQYKFAPEELSLNHILCQGTPYKGNETFAMGSLLTIIALSIGVKYRSKAATHRWEQFRAILHAKLCLSNNQAAILFFFRTSKL
jgi:hypothetical protein